MTHESTCNECVEQIKSFMCNYNEAVVWYSPWDLHADLDKDRHDPFSLYLEPNLSTRSYNKYMRIYPGMKSLSSTANGIELTKCQSTIMYGGLIPGKTFTNNGLFHRFEVPRIKYVNMLKSCEPGCVSIGNINYLVIEKIPEIKENPFVGLF